MQSIKIEKRWAGWSLLVSGRLAGIVVLMLCGLVGCASTVKQTMGFYHAPQRAYSLPLDSVSFRGQVTLTEGCDHVGGSLNIWDAQNRFFRIDYLRINQDPLAVVPPFAADRTIAEVVLANYERKVIPTSPKIKIVKNIGKVYITVRKDREALFAMVSLVMHPHAVPQLEDADRMYYYGFLIFKDRDLAYVLQHRMQVFQPDRMRGQLNQLANDLIIPGKPPVFSAPRTLMHWGHKLVHGVSNLAGMIVGHDTTPLVETCEWDDVIAKQRPDIQ